MTEGNIVQLGIFFDKDNRKYANDALLYQKILSLSLSGADHQSFTRWIMCTWLKENHPPFSNRSVDTIRCFKVELDIFFP